jgi:streptogramin lyase
MISLEDRNLLTGFTEFPLPALPSGGSDFVFGIAARRDGHIVVTRRLTSPPSSTDPMHPTFLGDEVDEVDPQGVVTILHAASSTDPYNGLTGIASAPDGSIWAVSNNDGLFHLTADGILRDIPLPAGVFAGSSITLGPDGAMWFTEPVAHNSPGADPVQRAIGRVDAGENLTDFALPPSRALLGQITTGPDGALWFTESGSAPDNNRIGRITTSGSVIEIVTPSQSASPASITTGPDGNLWFTAAGYGTNLVGEVTPLGSITEYGLPPLGGRDASGPAVTGIAAGPDGALYVAAFNSGQLLRVTANPVGITSLAIPATGATPDDITLGSDKSLWLTELTNNRVGRYEVPLPTPVVSTSYITSVVAKGLKGFGLNEVILSYNGPLELAAVQRKSRYLIENPGRDGTFGTRDDVVIRVKNVNYDAASNTVTLFLRTRLSRRTTYRILVDGQPVAMLK